MTAGKRLAGVWFLAASLLITFTLFAHALTPGLVIALALLAWDISLGSFIVSHALSAPLGSSIAVDESVSVLIAAYNEAPTIVATLAAVLAQRGVDFEVLLGDDGSSDATAAIAARTFAGDARVCIIPQAHAGKAAMLNRLLAHARFPLVLTLDADTTLAPDALRAMSARFAAEPAVVAAAAIVRIRRPHNWLTHFQTSEYIRNNFVRHAWASLGALEQVPGACAAFRVAPLREVGGFPLDSITEDYEVVYRLYARAAERRQRVLVAFVSDAVALTDGPAHLRDFARQRTRWFAGFLQTLVRFRTLIFNRHAGVFGVVKLPLKVIDAAIPLTSLVFLFLILTGASSPNPRVQHLSWALFVARWWWDAGCYAFLLRRESQRAPFAQPLWIWCCALGEALSYAWLRYVVMMLAYPLALKRRRGWEPPRAIRKSNVINR